MDSAWYVSWNPLKPLAWLSHSHLHILTHLISTAPSAPCIVETLPGPSNILHVAVEDVVSDAASDDDTASFIIATAADKSINLLSTIHPFDPATLATLICDSPTLSCAVLRKRYLVTSSMSGQIMLYDLRSGRLLDERRDHQKYVVKVAHSVDEEGAWIATAAWDAKVLLYRISKLGSNGVEPLIGNPVAVIELPTNPEAILFIQHPELKNPVLLLSRRDSTFIYYYAISDGTVAETSTSTDQALTLLGRQNLAPHSNAWIAFTPSAFALSPVDSSLLAVATSAMPHMKLIIVRLLLPPPILTTHSTSCDETSSIPIAVSTDITQASQARAALALSDREAAAILIHVTTLAPQTPYSTPGLAWRPNGSGLWVNGDDGVIRGVETSTGKIVASLKHSHEAGTKIRCLWSGWVQTAGRSEEWVVSGGFDRRLVVWRVQDSS